MTVKFCLLAGVIRPIPDVLTFVTPIFIGNDDYYYLQEVRDGQVIGFDRTNVGEEFQPVSSRYALTIGDQALYGFEVDQDQFLLSSATRLANFLRNLFSDLKQSSSGPCTAQAVHRFCEEVANSHKDLWHSHPELRFGPELKDDLSDANDAPRPQVSSSAPLQSVDIEHFLPKSGPSGTDRWLLFEVKRSINELKNVGAAPLVVSEVIDLTERSHRLWKDFETLSSVCWNIALTDPRNQHDELMRSMSKIQTDLAKHCVVQMQEAATNLVVLSADAHKKLFSRSSEYVELFQYLHDAYESTLGATNDMQRTVDALETKLNTASLGA
jgi:hypothetical protein